MKQYLQKKIKQFWNTSKQIVSNLFEKKLVKKTFNPYKNIPDPKLVFKDTLGMKDINRDSKIPENLKNILAEIENMGDRLRKLGESDGPYQMRYQTIREKVKSTASRTSKYIETIFKGISESVTNEIKVKKEKEQQIQNDIDATENYLKDLIKAKYWNPKNYLLWEAIIFLIFGLGLLAGDIVLSLSGTKEAFSLVGIEKWGMSIGITACAIFIKIYYDQYLLSAIERSVTTFKHENLKGIHDDKNKNLLKGVWGFRFLFNSALLAFLLCTIYLMGELRFEVSPPELKDLEYSRITFVLLSALFPIIGGVCLAIAIKKLRSFSLLWKTKKEQKKLRRKLYKTQKELSQFEQDSENCKTYINWTTTDEFIKELANFLFACYIHGYEYAYRKHNAGLDIMEKAEEIRRLFSGDSAQLNSDYPF